MRTTVQKLPCHPLFAAVFGLFVVTGCGKSAEATPTVAVQASAEAEEKAVPSKPSTPTPTSPPTPKPPEPPATKLQALAQTAVTQEAIEAIVKKNEWAFYPPGTTDCPSEPGEDRHVKLSTPDTTDEFEAKKLQGQRNEIAAEAVGKYIVLEGEGDVGSKDGNDLKGCCEATRSKYDFGKKAWTLTLSESDMGVWPLGATDPVFAANTLTSERDQEVGKLGGKSLTVKTLDSDTLYENHSKITINVPMSEAEAEKFKTSMHVKVLVVQKFVGLGFHKDCKRDCSPMMGVPVCVSLNHGKGMFYRASPVGYEVYVEGNLVAQKQP